MWDSVIHQILVLIFALATPPALMLIHKLLTKLANKLHIDAITKYNVQIDQLVAQAVNGVEKVAMNAVAASQTVKSGEQKLTDAITWVNGELARLKLDPIDPAKLATRIEATLMVADKAVVSSAPKTITG